VTRNRIRGATRNLKGELEGSKLKPAAIVTNPVIIMMMVTVTFHRGESRVSHGGEPRSRLPPGPVTVTLTAGVHGTFRRRLQSSDTVIVTVRAKSSMDSTT
jgi:hypothetical protein